jgi:predicted deacylase
VSPSAKELYPSTEELVASWETLCLRAGGRCGQAGESVEGRAVPRFDFPSTAEGAPAVLLSSLIHGVEVIGSIALIETVRRMIDALEPDGALPFRLVVLPVVNPDGARHTVDRLRAGRWAFRRCNARGVDLNRNFARVAGMRSWHPFAGSRLRVSPHYIGPAAFSEPETRAVRAAADDVRPSLSLAFHSFGEMLLYPWAHKRSPHPETSRYLRLAQAFVGAQSRPYRVMPSISLYPVIGDMDDWLDATYGTRAFTVEVGRPGARVRDPGMLLQPFWWMNSTDVAGTVANVIPGVAALLAAAAQDEDFAAIGAASAVARRRAVELAAH